LFYFLQIKSINIICFRLLSPQCLVQYWGGLGVEDGSQVLEDLGLSADEERLDLKIVSQKLNDEIGQAL
jgi:hypothetical protein